MDALESHIALALVREYLSALRDYPPHEDGQKCLARHLAKCAVSVDHARSILDAFRDDCPTPQGIHDVAYNEHLRAAFLPPEPPREERWIAAGYTLDSGFFARLEEEARHTMRKPGEPRQDDKMWAAIKKKLGVRDFARVPWGQCWAAAAELGFPLTAKQEEEVDRWRKKPADPERSEPDA